MTTRPAAIFIRQVSALTFSSLKARYRMAVVGFLWVILNPILTFGTQAFIFGKVLRIQVDNYVLFLLSGLLPWIFFTQSVEMCANSFVQYGPMIKSFRAHPTVYLVSQIADNFVNFIAVLLTALLPSIALGQVSLYQALFLPLPIISLAIGVMATCWILAIIQVFFRDFKFIASFLLSIAYFFTPIFYPPEFLPAEYFWLPLVNPFYKLILPFRDLLYVQNPSEFWDHQLLSFEISASLLLCAVALWKFRSHEVRQNV